MQQNVLFSAVNISKNIFRSFARRTKISNPGIQKRLNVLKDGATNFEDDVEEYESDFMNLEKVHKDHEKELKYFKEKEKFWIVKQKYFKDDKINFLTWNDKEQIRYLHQSNPEEWTIEKLSEGFPALPETIRKILKNKWQVKSESKKRNHDVAVEQNWGNLKAGKFLDTLPPNLINHLMKFTSRKANTNSGAQNLIESEDKGNFLDKEFSSIISNYEKIEIRNEIAPKINIREYCQTTSAIEEKLKSFGNKSVTLNTIKDVITDKNTIKSSSDTGILENLFDKDKNLPQKFSTIENKVSTNINSDKNSDLVSYPEKIKIPKDKYKKGFTYKVNDCYYDDDGEFLYRVPGMYQNYMK